MSAANDILVKFKGGECSVAKCGSKNPAAAAMAMSMLTEGHQFNVAHAQEAAAQSVGGILKSSGIALS